MGTNIEHDEKVVYTVTVDKELANILELEARSYSNISSCIADMLLRVPLSESTHRELQWKHIVGMSDADRQLTDTIMELESKYFPEMTFKDGSIVAEYMKTHALIDGNWVSYIDDVPEELTSLDASGFRFSVSEIDGGILNNIAGQAHRIRRTVMISPRCANEEKVIMHEMIHCYVDVINDNMPFFHDIILLCLYKDLEKKIPDLDERIKAHTHVTEGKQISIAGGSHDILFFLKSLDLDLRCNYKLGTVCGYGRSEYGMRSEKEAIRDIAIELLGYGRPISKVAETTGLTIEEIEAIAGELKYDED
jgi:hypothetical protein